MAQSRGRRSSSNSKSNSNKKRNRNNQKQMDRFENTIIDEVFFIVSLAISILLFLCNFHIIGKLGDFFNAVMFGIFGYMAYVAPLLIFFAVCFLIANLGNKVAAIKLISGTVLFCMLCEFFTLISGVKNVGNSLADYYRFSANNLKGGGIIGGFFGNGMYQLLDMAGTVIVMIFLIIICLVLLTEKTMLRDGGSAIFDYVKDDVERKKELAKERNERKIIEREQREAQLDEDSKKLRINKKVSGIASSDELNIKSKAEPDETVKEPEEKAKAPEIAVKPVMKNSIKEKEMKEASYIDPMEALSKIKIRGIDDSDSSDKDPETREKGMEIGQNTKDKAPEDVTKKPVERLEAENQTLKVTPVGQVKETVGESEPIKKSEPQKTVEAMEVPKQTKPKAPYKFPPIDKLKVGKKSSNLDNSTELKETAARLQETLHTFGVDVDIVEISKGPAVTRYELQPKVGVKVSKIVNLADDIKLNLAATDIRIEAPIPGKSAVGIEVPNKENAAVAFRELIESNEFKKAESNISFAVGKDIAGQTIVTDLAKMPHLLIAGATGSGKSVCINTIIMSILYKAKPEDVKLIMIDPKVVELSVYNGIPHLMIPVVTDPKKAAAALKWGVSEMEERYRKFADLNVRDLKGYNQKVSQMNSSGGEEVPEKLPQILIIVDELADLMMVASNEVEEAICRLAQLARACGIHLVIATQRPSVDVITGLIKANMPSRIAFAVSSGVDSRTILDNVGAEKLLGKGDMLFYPQGKSKPERVQGAFVSDEEVTDVVEFIKSQEYAEETRAAEIEEKISNISASNSSGTGSSSPEAPERDPYFEEAGKFIINKDKASIGMLQRIYKIGFNRAARIMDQLEEVGVVGPEEGTKPRKVLMTMLQFEQLLEEIYR